MILIDHLQRHEALARIRQRDRHRPGVEIEHRRGIERVAVLPNDGLGVDGRQLAVVLELAEAAFLERHGAEVQVGLGADEVLDGDRHGVARLRCAEDRVELR